MSLSIRERTICLLKIILLLDLMSCCLKCLVSKVERRLSENLSRRDGELNLLIREGENVTSRLRNVLTTSLRSPGPVFRPPLSTQPPRHSPPEPQPRGFSPGRYSPGRYSPGRPYRSELTLEDETTRPLKSDFPRSRSMSDIRQQQQQQPQPQPQGSDSPK
ncbi:hypothetical protein Anas_06226 [Armadillidium nasatum]|uniref:Uncharacterized protein n=1 Tax=Armadillidium nasatum TaxID=96803 RepID=A0A5N5SSU5_9CRUS|nr:hypothetical protein Anas_06226 [Armadillidium nasatum]